MIGQTLSNCFWILVGLCLDVALVYILIKALTKIKKDKENK